MVKITGKPHTRLRTCQTVAKGLVEFGYPDCTPEMIDEVLTAFLEGKRGADLPHGVIGQFAERQFLECHEIDPEYLKRP